MPPRPNRVAPHATRREIRRSRRDGLARRLPHSFHSRFALQTIVEISFSTALGTPREPGGAVFSQRAPATAGTMIGALALGRSPSEP
jgi:hypothetical protein